MASETIYDHPLYYDILFGWDRSAETEFYDAIFRRLGVGDREPVLEVACGTGQVARRLARLGRRVSGIDNRAVMVDFLRSAAAAEGSAVEVSCDEMETFSSATRFGAAYNPMSSFRLLQTDEDAELHLTAMTRALRPRGVYVLDLELRADSEAPAKTTDEAWTMMRDNVEVRANDDGVRVTDDGVELALSWGVETHLRGYTPQGFVDRVAAVPDLAIESWHPESGREGDASVFDQTGQAAAVTGRTMVVLRRA